MTRTEWQARIVECRLSGLWPDGYREKAALLAGCCEACDTTVDIKTGTVESSGCQCGKITGTWVDRFWLPACERCGASLMAIGTTPSGNTRLKCRCGFMTTATSPGY